MLLFRRKRRSQASAGASSSSRPSQSGASSQQSPDNITEAALVSAEISTQVDPKDFLSQSQSRSALTKTYKSMTIRYKALIHCVQDELQCVICLDDYNMPRLLNCGHSFCTSCLKAICRGNTSVVKCPTCRQQTKINTMRIEDLPLNYPLIQIQDVVKEIEGSQQSLLKCQVHKREEVKFWCRSCDELICGDCMVASNNNCSSRNNSIDSGVQVSAAVKEQDVCGCDDKVEILAPNHNGHDIVTLKDAAVELYTEIKSQNEKALQSLQSIRKLKSKLETNKKDLEINYSGITSHINREFDNMIYDIDKRRQQLLEEARRMRVSELERIETDTKRMEVLSKEIESSLGSAQILINNKLFSFQQACDGNRTARYREIYEIWKNGPAIKQELRKLTRELDDQIQLTSKNNESKRFIDCQFMTSDKVSLQEGIEGYGEATLTADPHVSMQVKVKTTDGQSQQCNLRAWEDKVTDLQEKIRQQLSVPVPMQKLIVNGEPISSLGPSATIKSIRSVSSTNANLFLSSYGIEDGTTVEVNVNHGSSTAN